MKTERLFTQALCNAENPCATTPTKEVNETVLMKHLVEGWRQWA
jgi:hypothetical protein